MKVDWKKVREEAEAGARRLEGKEDVRCASCFWVDGERGPRRCVLDAGHMDGVGRRGQWHWKGAAEWNDQGVEAFGGTGRLVTLEETNAFWLQLK